MNKRTTLPFMFLFSFVGFLVEDAGSFRLSVTAQQMEMRRAGQYDQRTFEKSKPAVGELAPDIRLKTLDGQAVQLSAYRGKNIVVIKAGYT